MITDRTWKVTYCNRSFAQTIAYKADDIVGQYLETFLTKGSALFCQNIIFPSILHDNKIGEVQINFLNKATGMPLPTVALAKSTSVSMDEVVWCFSSATERDKLVSALNQSKKQLETMNEQLKALATTDELTGTYNRRELSVRLHVIRRQTERRDSCFSVFMIDMDNFKQINDQLGHVEGDRILKQFGFLLMKNARIDDVVARYGGEEFIIIMPDVNIDTAQLAADKIHKSINSITTSLGLVTISIGVCCIKAGNNMTENEIFETADKMLYESKAGGKNTSSFQGCL